jgi:hypothetical protein
MVLLKRIHGSDTRRACLVGESPDDLCFVRSHPKQAGCELARTTASAVCVMLRLRSSSHDSREATNCVAGWADDGAPSCIDRGVRPLIWALGAARREQNGLFRRGGGVRPMSGQVFVRRARLAPRLLAPSSKQLDSAE